jgi:N-acyl homoserine lactone hydrolase
MSLAVHAFTCGHLDGEFGRVMEGGEGDITMPVPAFLIEHPNGRALFDTGLHPDCRHDPVGRLGQPCERRLLSYVFDRAGMLEASGSRIPLSARTIA